MLRARREEHKDERRKVLLDAALELFRESPFAAVKMADIASRAGFAKGTVFVYYPTKEALFLALTDRELGDWVDELVARLDESVEVKTPEGIARLVARSLVEREALVRLLPLMTAVLEHNVTVEQVIDLKVALLERIVRLGSRIEERLPELPSGSGAHLVVRTYALIVGLQACCESGPTAEKAREQRPELVALRFDFAAELESALAVVMRGVIASAKS